MIGCKRYTIHGTDMNEGSLTAISSKSSRIEWIEWEKEKMSHRCDKKRRLIFLSIRVPGYEVLNDTRDLFRGIGIFLLSS